MAYGWDEKEFGVLNMAVTKKYWWYDEPEIGSYKFCYGGSWDYDFYIEEVSVKYVYGWTEEERQRRFKGAKFIWGGCCDGVSYHDTLKSDNIEDAKREFEAWYKQYLACCVERLEDALAAAKEEYENFLLYHKEV